MTYEEAIECINNVLSSKLQYDDSIDYQVTIDDIEWLDMAIEALKIQIPEKPYWRVVEGDVMEENIEGYACPVCDMGVETDHGRIKLGRCTHCGKVLDWGYKF